MLSVDHKRWVITGAPASGKTECWNRLKQEPALDGWIFFEELARKLLAERPDLRRESAALHREIYRLQIEREAAAADRSFVTDRGTVDAFAFHPETLKEVGTTLELEYQRYSSVILLKSAANLGEEFYTKDEIRTESTEETLKIEQALLRVWKEHPALYIIESSERFESKYRCVLDALGLTREGQKGLDNCRR